MSALLNVEHSYRTELVRKAIHLSSLSIPIVYFFITKAAALTILVPLTLAFVLADVARFSHEPTRTIFEQYFGSLLRAHERGNEVRRLNGATYVLLSAAVCIWVFPKVIVITAFAILIISDTSAALIGRKYGRHPFLKKSFEGTLAFFVSALIVVAITPKVEYHLMEYIIGAIAALCGALIEALSIAVDDNLSIPIGIGIVTWVLYILFLPGVNVFALDALS
jgi:dolichol kinase